MLSALEIQIQTLPCSAGVYQFYDKEHQILYVGKAVNLKKRVSSYFQKKHNSEKTRVLVKKIASIEHIVVQTETDALLLENNLIKKYQPRYNILLKDDKSYPWICIKNEPFPRVFTTRNVIKDGSAYFGPYPHIRVVRTLMELLSELYPIRTCNYDLSEKNILSDKFKVCLEYHIHNCKGPCQAKQSQEEYNQNISEIKEILKGNFGTSLKRFKQQMISYAQNMQFEQAHLIKQKIQALEKYQAKSTIVSTTINNVDVFSILTDQQSAYINFLQIAHGAVVRAHTFEVKKKLDESDKEILEYAVLQTRQRYNSHSKEIIVPFDIAHLPEEKITIPKQGEKAQLLALSVRNVQFFRQERLKQIKVTDPERHTHRILSQMQRDLHLPSPPIHIECFDNSNLQGTQAVSACVVFKNGKPSKKDYRHFNIKTVEGPNDFASMEEIVFRRYKQILNQQEALPNLIIIDGGKGQLSSALNALEKLNLRGKIPIIGIAKRLEEIFFPDDPIPLYLDKSSETLKIIQQARNEAHRFGITFHRHKRSKNAIQSQLNLIKGIGEKTQQALLRHFKSVKRIQEAPLSEISSLIGAYKAQLVYQFFHQNE